MTLVCEKDKVKKACIKTHSDAATCTEGLVKARTETFSPVNIKENCIPVFNGSSYGILSNFNN